MAITFDYSKVDLDPSIIADAEIKEIVLNIFRNNELRQSNRYDDLGRPTRVIFENSKGCKEFTNLLSYNLGNLFFDYVNVYEDHKIQIYDNDPIPVEPFPKTHPFFFTSRYCIAHFNWELIPEKFVDAVLEIIDTPEMGIVERNEQKIPILIHFTDSDYRNLFKRKIHSLMGGNAFVSENNYHEVKMAVKFNGSSVTLVPSVIEDYTVRHFLLRVFRSFGSSHGRDGLGRTTMVGFESLKQSYEISDILSYHLGNKFFHYVGTDHCVVTPKMHTYEHDPIFPTPIPGSRAFVFSESQGRVAYINWENIPADFVSCVFDAIEKNFEPRLEKNGRGVPVVIHFYSLDQRDKFKKCLVSLMGAEQFENSHISILTNIPFIRCPENERK